MPKLSVIIPCYYNEDNIPVTVRELMASEASFPPKVSFEYVLANDSLGNDTIGVLHRARAAYPGRIRIVDLAANVVGTAYATGHCKCVITDDMQDLPEPDGPNVGLLAE